MKRFPAFVEQQMAAEVSTAALAKSAKVVDTLPIRNSWIKCFAVVEFDLEYGQSMFDDNCTCKTGVVLT